MLTLANVDGHLTKPFPGGRGTCPGCQSVLLAVCGKQVTHHWRHESGDDCDSWSEHLGPWHLSWQAIVNQTATEVWFEPHRADIVGNGNIVVELQHSPLSPDEIEAREAFYGNMLWVFDATHRFATAQSGDISFFSFGRTKHISECTKPVFLDFGDYIVEVQHSSDLFHKKCHGYGAVRSHEWFADNYLSSVRNITSAISIARSDDRKAHPWRDGTPYHWTRYPTPWMQPDSQIKLLPKGTVYFPVNRYWKSTGEPLTTDIITRCPELGNGWTHETLARMKSLITAQPIIIDGKLRLLPVAVEYMRNSLTSNAVAELLPELRSHIQAGRIAVLKESTIERLATNAISYETEQYGQPLPRPPADPQRRLL